MKITPANKHFLMNESGKMKRVSPAGTGSEATPLVPLSAPASLDAVTPDGASGAVRLVWGEGGGEEEVSRWEEGEETSGGRFARRQSERHGKKLRIKQTTGER